MPTRNRQARGLRPCKPVRQVPGYTSSVWRARDPRRVDKALEALRHAAVGSESLIPHFLEAAAARAGSEARAAEESGATSTGGN